MENFAALAFLAASVLFILALRGLSHSETARQGLNFGMIGMGIAIITSLLLPQVGSWFWVLIAIGIGGGIGTTVAQKIEMTALPQLMAAFHSLVGLAAVFVATAAFYSPEAFGIGSRDDIHLSSLIEMSLGLAIGAITFTGSIIAWGKLQGTISGKPVTFGGQHALNGFLGYCWCSSLSCFASPKARFSFG